MDIKIKSLFDYLHDSETITEEEDKWINRITVYYDEYEILTGKQIKILEDIRSKDTLRK